MARSVVISAEIDPAQNAATVATIAAIVEKQNRHFRRTLTAVGVLPGPEGGMNTLVLVFANDYPAPPIPDSAEEDV